jgi:arginine decarboxylase
LLRDRAKKSLPSTLAQNDLRLLYGGVYNSSNPALVDDSQFRPSQLSAFESVRTFFEELGASFHRGDLEDQVVFESFSLPAETYWTTVVSPWLNNWLSSKNPERQATLGTEYRYLECAMELKEQQIKAPLTGGVIKHVLEEDAHLPDMSNPPETAASVNPKLKIFGMKIPTDYFVTKGTGESDQGLPPDPYETFSYDIALRQARIEDFNIVPYTSVLPPEATEVPLQQLKPNFRHGAVLEVIMAKEGGIKNQTVCAGIGRVWAADASGRSVGGYAAEYKFTHDRRIAIQVAEQQATAQLERSLNHELHIRGFYQVGNKKYEVACLPIRKKYGMAISAIGFTKFIYPEPEAAQKGVAAASVVGSPQGIANRSSEDRVAGGSHPPPAPKT